ncbi:hypothetical protein RSOL_457060 [Rhizoctonia solani AG-3 Rhs1AP]|uniref:Uncharacterized protein n=1 Tax=Rhizoctonia solani AG-3 Rhs1AP TaxID=1086054 RepID=X8JIP0_9AGAM|nr:hypothetical protein RSOL_457060 [Rhizoctonia solani AG-3 Rhs1AP]
MDNISRAEGLANLAQAAAELARAATTLSEAALVVANMFTGESDNAPVESIVGAGGINVTRNDLAPVVNVEPSPSTCNQPETDPNELPKPCRIFVDYEADVLVYACALIQNRKQVICYVHHSVSALELYATLLREVCPTLVYTIENTTQDELDRIGSDFLKANNSVLLLPETVCPKIELLESDSWVIHLGWPVDMLTYFQHIRAHKARNNLFIAHSDDRWTPISGVNPEHQSISWPGDIDSLKQIASAMRTSFKHILSEIPIALKEDAYLDYIACHGPHGHRNCSWDPSSLAYYANAYLLDVLQYTNPPHDCIEGIRFEPSLPEVTLEFVKHHGLEPAVREGVMQMEEIDTGLNHMSSLPKDDQPTTETVMLNETGPSNHYSLEPRSPQGVCHPEGDATNTNRVRSVGVGASLFFCSSIITSPQDEIHQIILSPPNLLREYLIIEAEYDIIPTIYHLARQVLYSNVICFVKCLNTTEALIEPMKKMIMRPIHVVRVGDPMSTATKEALRSRYGCIVFCDMLFDLHPELSNEELDLVIHVGWPNGGIYKDHTQLPALRTHHILLSRKEVNGSSGSLLLTQLRQMGVSAIDSTIERDFNLQTDFSTIALERILWRSALSLALSATDVRSYYMAWITHHFSGPYKQQDWTAIDVVNNANRHVKEVLLNNYGTVTAEYVAHFKLEEAVTTGILRITG